MKFVIEASFFPSASPARERECRLALHDLNLDLDGQPPLLTVAPRDDGGADFLVVTPGGDPARVSLPFAKVRALYRDYRDIIVQLVRGAGGAFGMRDLETLDYAKKLVHDEAAEVIQGVLRGAASVDHATARRIFTLVFLISPELPDAFIGGHRGHGGL